ncbi:MAG: hypothetical protein GXP01_07170 [Alphaproteobacteria bacterium]|nr:hypothetical protein [Alphaproteobacteria bacterium]
MSVFKVIGLALVAVIAGGVLWFFWQKAEFSRLTSAQLDQVLGLRSTGEPRVPAELAAQVGLNPGLPAGAVAMRIAQRGAIRTTLDGPWQSYEAEQTIALGRSGFVWLARVPIIAGQGIEVIDSYDGDAGLLQVRLLGALTLDTATGPQVDAAELQRYLAELPMAPGAMARNADLGYLVRDDGSVRIWDKTTGDQIWVEALLDSKGRIGEVRADGRARGVKGGYVMTPWGGAFSDWVVMDGYEVPRRGEVWWVIEGEKSVYWRGEITGITALDENGEPIGHNG